MNSVFTKSVRSAPRRRLGVGALALAGAAALTLGVGGAAFASPILAGEYDVAEVGVNASQQLEIGGHDHSGDISSFDPETYEYRTDSAYAGGWVITEGGVLSLGLSGDQELFTGLGGDGSELTYDFRIVQAPAAHADFELFESGQSAIIDSAAADLSETVELSQPVGPEYESFHQHYNWGFDTVGTYEIGITASTPGGLAGDSDEIVLTFDVVE